MGINPVPHPLQIQGNEIPDPFLCPIRECTDVARQTDPVRNKDLSTVPAQDVFDYHFGDILNLEDGLSELNSRVGDWLDQRCFNPYRVDDTMPSIR